MEAAGGRPGRRGATRVAVLVGAVVAGLVVAGVAGFTLGTGRGLGSDGSGAGAADTDRTADDGDVADRQGAGAAGAGEAGAAGGRPGTGGDGAGGQRGPGPVGVGGDGQAVAVDAVEVGGGTVRVELTAANPATAERALGSRLDPPLLVGADGEAVEAGAADLVLAPLRATGLALTFPAPAGDAGDLRFNARTDGLGEPAVTVPGVPLRPGRVVFGPRAAGTAAPEDLVAVHPNGLSVSVRTVTAGPDGVAITLLAVNGGAGEVRLAADAPVLEDAAGRRLVAVPAAADPELTVPGRARLTGTLRFAGTPVAGVRDLTLVLNGRRGADGDRTRVPRLRVDGLPVPPAGAAEAAAVTAPAAVDLDLRVEHPGGTAIIVRGATFHEDRVQVEVTAANGSGRDVALATDGLVLRDDLGTVHRLSPPPDDPRVPLPAGATVEGTLVFLGRAAPSARTLTLVTNVDAPTAGSPLTLRPTLTIAGIPAPPAPTPPVSEGDPTPVPSALDDPGPSPVTGGGGLTGPREGDPAPGRSPVDGTGPSAAPPGGAATGPKGTGGDVAAGAEAGGGGGGSVPLVRSEVRLAPQVVSVLGPGQAVGDGRIAAGEASATERALAELGARRTAEGLVVTLPEPVLFAFDDDEVRAGAAPTLERIAAILAATPDAAVEVRGHTDRTGDDAYNQALSERRAAAVAGALVDRGTPAARLTAQGFGERRPAGTDDAANRRVEVVVLLA